MLVLIKGLSLVQGAGLSEIGLTIDVSRLISSKVS